MSVPYDHLRPRRTGRARREQGPREHPTGEGQRAWGSPTEHPKGAHRTEQRPRGRAAGAHPTGHQRAWGARPTGEHQTGPGGARWMGHRMGRGQTEPGPKGRDPTEHPKAGAGAGRQRARPRAWEHRTGEDQRA